MTEMCMHHTSIVKSAKGNGNVASSAANQPFLENTNRHLCTVTTHTAHQISFKTLSVAVYNQTQRWANVMSFISLNIDRLVMHDSLFC